MKTITGSFQHADGTPVANGTLRLLLSQDVVTSSPMTTLVHEPVVIQLDGNGAIPAGQQIWASDEVLPQNSYYHIVVISPTAGKVYDERLPITGPSPISLNSLVPPLIPS